MVEHIGRGRPEEIRSGPEIPPSPSELIRSIYNSAIQLQSHVASLNSDIKRLVYNFYGELPTDEKLSGWIHLLNGLQKIDSSIELFTTNYDLVLETACEVVKIRVQDGFDRRQRPPRLDLDYWNPSHGPLGDHVGLLTKMHGSVDWQHNNGKIVLSTPRFTEDHANHCILYPGYKGTPTEEPFVTFHTHLRNVVCQEYGPVHAAIFIGFAFRDDAINEILSHLPSETPQYVITKADGENPEQSGLDRASDVLHNIILIGTGFDEGIAQFCLNNITERIWKQAARTDVDSLTEKQNLPRVDPYGTLMLWEDFGRQDEDFGWTIVDGVAVAFTNLDKHTKT